MLGAIAAVVVVLMLPCCYYCQRRQQVVGGNTRKHNEHGTYGKALAPRRKHNEHGTYGEEPAARDYKPSSNHQRHRKANLKGHRLASEKNVTEVAAGGELPQQRITSTNNDSSNVAFVDVELIDPQQDEPQQLKILPTFKDQVRSISMAHGDNLPVAFAHELP